MNIPSQANTPALAAPQLGSDQVERLKRYRAGRCVEFSSTCVEFEQLQEEANSFLQMSFVDLVDLYCMQCGWESLEECYEHYVHHEPYGLAKLNAEIERLRLAAVASKEGHNAVLAHLAAFQPQAPVG
jgi:hypothetical protein